MKEKVNDKHAWIDRNVQNSFHRGVGVGTLKYVMGYNHHGKRNNKINKGLPDAKCPRCKCQED